MADTKTVEPTKTVIKQWMVAADDDEREATGKTELPMIELIYVEYPDGDGYFQIHVLANTFDVLGFDAYWEKFEEAHDLAFALKKL